MLRRALSPCWLSKRLSAIRRAIRYKKIGFIKYNAFENIGNDLSFALTLLDGNNNGICISSIYGRSESRIFSKPIVKGKSLVSLSQEELESLNEALGERTNEEALTSAIVSK